MRLLCPFQLLTIVAKKVYTKFFKYRLRFLATNAQYGKTKSFESRYNLFKSRSKWYQQNINKHLLSTSIVEIHTREDSS